MPTETTHRQLIEHLVEGAIAEAGLVVPEAQLKELVMILTERVSVMIFMELLSALSPAQAAAVQASIEADGDPKDMIERLRTELPDFGPRFAAALVRSYEEISRDLTAAA